MAHGMASVWLVLECRVSVWNKTPFCCRCSFVLSIDETVAWRRTLRINYKIYVAYVLRDFHADDFLDEYAVRRLCDESHRAARHLHRLDPDVQRAVHVILNRPPVSFGRHSRWDPALKVGGASFYCILGVCRFSQDSSSGCRSAACCCCSWARPCGASWSPCTMPWYRYQISPLMHP